MADIRIVGRHIPTVWLVAGGGWVGRAIQVIAQLFAVRILTDHLGTGGYSVFAIMSGVVGWFALSDFSIAISMQNHISERRAANRPFDDVVLTGALLSLAATLCFGLLLLVTGPWLAELTLGKVDFLSAHERLLVFYSVALPNVGLALGTVVYKMWFAQHRGYLSNLLPALGTVLGSIGIWLVPHGGIGETLLWSQSIYYGAIALVPVLALLRTLLSHRREEMFNRALVPALLGRAVRFWGFGILAAGVLQVDYIIAAKTLPATDIVIYNIANRIFLLVFFVYNALILALWPVCSEAIASSRWHEVFQLLRRYIVIGVAFTFFSGVAIEIANPLIVQIIAPSVKIVIPSLVIALLTLYIIFRVWTDTFSMVLQSMNDLTILWITVPVQSFFSIVLQTIGARYFGLPGMISGLILCFVLTVAWVLPLRCLKHARARQSSASV